ncbi:hypothetical protein NZ698_16990 [Chryseobacterium sp. PBS4-4]|uniref:Uncharacterized protein n=1 Tax=Chryseobacterium edaphi TaxID=2976532 RepID=A0ABT2W9L7_9FLAO|nr:hypothetical protein [Chryseobacterium edaphi]MCU7618879.1 hypothetical protein [Chryseobacterium edaphi]
MRNIIKYFLLFFTVLISGQELKKDTLKYTDIETVIINDKDYEKIDYSFALKQEINFRLKSVNPYSGYEIGLRFNNNLKQKGRISNVILYLHKTESKVNLTNLEINFYKINPKTGLPEEKLNTQQIIYTPKNKRRGQVKINVENHHIPFSEEGVLVSVKWLPNEFKDVAVGPAIRLTNYTEKLTYVSFNNDMTKWNNRFNFSKKLDIYTNVMLGLEVYIKKKKKNE